MKSASKSSARTRCAFTRTEQILLVRRGIRGSDCAATMTVILSFKV